MQDDPNVPSWTRRRLRRHLARRGGPMVVRWMRLATKSEAAEPVRPARPPADNVVMLRPRTAACG